jgi:DNA polymerase III sliding clamp (beta) subunit (PCNA family)
MTKVPQSRPANPSIKILKSDFVEYLNIARGQCKYRLCLIEITSGENNVYCYMQDPISYKVVDETINTDGGTINFKFNVDYMLTICKQFEGEELSMYEDGVKLFIHDEYNKFLTIIMKVQ